MWDLSCSDWQSRIRTGQSLIPTLPLFGDQARDGLAFFDAARLPDQPDEPRLGDAAGEWFREIVRVAFGSWDPIQRARWIRDIFLLAPKGQSKTSYFAALIIALLLMNRRRNAEGIFVGPTQSISDRAYEQTVGMIELDAALKRRFRPIDHQKTILDRITGTEAKVKTFDLNILTGGILIFAMVDELHLLGRNVHTTKVLRQIRGGLDKTPEGLLLIASTQSDDIPAGAFKDELTHARKVRDGEFREKLIRPLLPILYEFPGEIAKESALWQEPANWPMVLPNLGRSTHLRDMIPDWNTEKEKGEHAIRIWASQHLNIQIGLMLRTDHWVGAKHWEKATDETLSLQTILERCEVAIVGIDGGGLDDLFGLAVLGRECEEIEIPTEVDGAIVKGSIRVKRWLLWSHAWCHRDVLETRKSIATNLLDFQAAGDLTIVDDRLFDTASIVGIVKQIRDAGLLGGVAVDPAGLGELVDELAMIEVTQENKLLVGVGQGIRMMNAIKTAERRLARGTLLHAGSDLMAWCVGNLKIEPMATAIRATKQSAGDAKIDPIMAMFDAVDIMSTNPEALGQSGWQTDDLDALMEKIDAATFPAHDPEGPERVFGGFVGGSSDYS